MGIVQNIIKKVIIPKLPKEKKKEVVVEKIPPKKVDAPYDVIVVDPKTGTGYSKTYPSKKAYTGGGGSGGSPTPSQIVADVKEDVAVMTAKETAKQQEIQSNLQKIEQQRQDILYGNVEGINTTQIDPEFLTAVVTAREAGLKKDIKDVDRLDYKTIDNLVKKGKITPDEAIKTYAYTINKDVLNRYERDMKNKEEQLLKNIIPQYENDLQKYRKDLIEKVNNGYSVDLANKELEQYNKQLLEKYDSNLQKNLQNYHNTWINSTGKSLENTTKSALAWKRIEYLKDSNLNLKKLAGETGVAFIKGVVTGGIFTGVTRGALAIPKVEKVATAVSKPISSIIKSSGTTGTGLLVAGSFAKNVGVSLAYQNIKLYEQYQKQGFSKQEAQQLAKAESGIYFVQGQIKDLGYIGGISVGSGIVNMGANYLSNINRLSVNDQRLIDSALKKNPNAIKVYDSYGKITESDIRLLKKSKVGDIKVIKNGVEINKPITQLKTGEIVRYQKIGVDIERLTPTEIKALERLINKGKISGSGLTTTRLIDNKFTQESSFNIKYGKTQRFGISETKGTIDASGNIRGVRTSTIFDVQKKLINIQSPKTFNPKNYEVSAIYGKGNVKYTNKGLLRLESGKVVEVPILRADITDKGVSLFSDSKITKIATSNKLSLKTGIDVKLFTGKDGGAVSVGQKFVDVKTWEGSRLLPNLDLNINKFPVVKGGENAINLFNTKTGGSAVSKSLFSQSIKVATIPETPLINIQDVVSTTAKTLIPTTSQSNIIAPIINLKTETESLIIPSAQKVNLAPPRKLSSKLSPIIFGGIFEPSKVSSSQSSSLAEAQLQIPAQTPQQIAVPLLSIPNLKTPNIPVRPSFDIGEGLPLSFLGDVEVGGGKKGGGGEVKLFGKTRYNPSLGSILLRQKPKKVSKKEYERLSKIKYTGTELRPLVEVNETKKTKKKKAKRVRLF